MTHTATQTPDPRRIRLVVFAATIGALAGGFVVWAGHHGDTSTSSGTTGSGIAATETRSVAPFTGVELGGSASVDVHVGGEQAVVVHADDNLIDRVTTDVGDGTLVVGTTGSFTTDSPMTVDVTVPELDSAALSGSGVVVVDGVGGRTFVAGTPGSGVLRVSGNVDRLEATLDGSGDMQLEGLVARDATAVVGGSGRIRVHATRSLDASVTGSGAIFFSGDPATVNRSVTGSGAIIAE